MINTNDPILIDYEIRKSGKEKTRFLNYLQKRLERSGYDPMCDMQIEEKGKGILKSRNLVVGNPKEAKILLGAHYDTCALCPFPNVMAPLSVPLFILAQCMIGIFLLVLMLLGVIIICLTTKSAEFAAVFNLVLLYAFLFQIMFGYRNSHTANDNTSGVIALTHFLEKLPKELRKNVCVVYFDNEEKGLFGSSFFFKLHKDEVNDKLLINLDCVGDGKQVYFMANKKMAEDLEYQNICKVMEAESVHYDVEFGMGRISLGNMTFSSDQMHFPKGIGVCALRKGRLGQYVARIHTPFDRICRKTNIEFLTEGLCTMVMTLYQ